jgi:ABC-type phosphate/phosphonate transport system substrate-binding protein
MLRTNKFGQNDVKVITTRYQDAVPFYIDNGFANAGATAANSVVKQWTDKGGKVVGKSRSVPIKQFIVSNKVPQRDRDAIRDVLLGLGQNDQGKRALSAFGYKGVVSPDPEIEKATIGWLGL